MKDVKSTLSQIATGTQNFLSLNFASWWKTASLTKKASLIGTFVATDIIFITMIWNEEKKRTK
jgi:hypothetical protein